MLSDHTAIVRITLEPTEGNTVAYYSLPPPPRPITYTTLELDLLMQRAFFFFFFLNPAAEKVQDTTPCHKRGHVECDTLG